jgi:hypothetical protein
MTKSLGTIVGLTVMFVFIWGCQPEREHTVALQQDGESQKLHFESESQDAEQQELNRQQVGAEEVEPQPIQPQDTEPREAEHQETEPEVVKSEQIAPEQAKPEEKEPQAQEQPAEEDEFEGETELDVFSAMPAFYEACQDVFNTYVNEEGLVDYETLRRKRAGLINAVKLFNEVHPAREMAWNDNEKIAFWINAHNIFTLKLIIDNYPIQPRWYLINYPDNSIMQIVGGRTKKYFRVMGMQYTLKEIEREILMARFGDPRIFFALSYASMGGAFLRNELYCPDKLDRQLDEQVRKYLSSPQGFRIDKGRKEVFLSDIFNWYKPVFVDKYGSIKKFREHQPHIQSYLNFIINYVSPENAGYLESVNYEVEFQIYDWRLNEQPD